MRPGRAVIVAVLVFLTVPPVAAQEDDDPTEADHLTVVAQTPWVAPGGTFALRLRVDDPPEGAQLRTSLHGPVRTRSEFVRTLDGEGLRSSLTDLDPAPVDGLTEREPGSVDVRIATGTVTGEPVAVELGPDEEGVYPVVVDLLDADDDVVDRVVTHLVRLPDPNAEETPLGAVLVVPLHAPPSHVAPGDVDTAALAPLDATADALLARPGVAVTLVPTPEAIAGAAEADPRAADRFAQLAVGRTVLARPWVRLDQRAWNRGGLDEELDRQLVAGRDAVEDAFATAPVDDVAVLAEGGGEIAVDVAVDAGAEVVLVPETDLEPLDEDEFPVTLTRPFEVETGDGDVAALMVDAGLAAHVGATGDSVLDAHRLLADLAVLALDAPLSPRAAVVVLDDEAAADTAFLEALLGGLDVDQPPRQGAAPLVAATDVDGVLADVEPAEVDGDPLVREVLEGNEPSSVTGVRADLAEARAALGSYASAFGADDPLAAEVDELILTAGASSLSSGERQELLGTGVGALRAELAQIYGPPQQRVTFTAREGQVQLVLTNETGRPVDVALELRGDRLEFPGREDRRLLVGLDGETTAVDLTVRARSSGDAPLDLTITTPDGRVELGRSRVFVRSTAVSGVGLVLMGAAGLFLVVWWTRTILRERGTARRRRAAHAR